MGLGYLYPLSKRTNLYAVYGRSATRMVPAIRLRTTRKPVLGIALPIWVSGTRSDHMRWVARSERAGFYACYVNHQ